MKVWHFPNYSARLAEIIRQRAVIWVKDQCMIIGFQPGSEQTGPKCGCVSEVTGAE